jgi:radical SAM superfamily enzyme YgiQ (UPF0313 family)
MQMVAAVLEQAGHEVHLLDANAALRKRSSEDIVRFTKDLRPDIVGMTLLTPMIREAYRLAQLLKELGVKLLAGGPHATLLPEEPLSFGFDAVVVGEGESTVAEAVRALQGLMAVENVKGLVYLDDDGKPRHTELRPLIENLNDLPRPARHLVNPLDYGPAQNPALYSDIFSSRGCPAKCSYCSGSLFGKKFRFRSAGSVLEEIFHLHRTYGTTHFHFVDDAMSMDKARVKQICEALIQSGHKITWSMMTRIDSVSEELLALVSRAGCVQIEYGVESGSPETLRKIHKPHTVEMVRKVIPLTSRHGIRPCVFFILGFPWEAASALDDTKRLMRELAPHVACFHPAIASILIPFPCTEIYESYKNQYNLENWWLKEARSYDAPRLGTHSYLQTKIFPLGAVLDADFFNYPVEVKQKIHDIFKFMYFHDLRNRGKICQTLQCVLICFSEWLYLRAPSLESRMFSALIYFTRNYKNMHLNFSMNLKGAISRLFM